MPSKPTQMKKDVFQKNVEKKIKVSITFSSTSWCNFHDFWLFNFPCSLICHRKPLLSHVDWNEETGGYK